MVIDDFVEDKSNEEHKKEINIFSELNQQGSLTFHSYQQYNILLV